MCAPALLPILAIATTVGATAYGAKQQKDAAKDASKAQEKANKESEEALKAKTPEQQTQASGLSDKRLNAMRAGYAKNIRTSESGDLSKPATTSGGIINQPTKTKIGE